jgi:hypothetical protein
VHPSTIAPFALAEVIASRRVQFPLAAVSSAVVPTVIVAA